MNKYLPAIVWTLALYAGTTLTAGKAFTPQLAEHATPEQLRAAWFWFDFQHVILHAAAYGALAGLLALPAWDKTKKSYLPRMAAFLLIVTIVGLGQEAIQTVIRWEVRLADSLGDLVSNVSGAALILGIVLAKRWQQVLRPHQHSLYPQA